MFRHCDDAHVNCLQHATGVVKRGEFPSPRLELVVRRPDGLTTEVLCLRDSYRQIRASALSSVFVFT